MDRGKWSQQGVPHRGWVFQFLEDLGDLDGTCEMCETQSIRYVHYMAHPDYDDVLGVGSVCAGHMEEDYAAAREREKQARSRFNRRVRWLEARWRVSARGNHYLNRNGFNVVVHRRSGLWAYRIEERVTGEWWSDSGFSSENDAKLAAFETYAGQQG